MFLPAHRARIAAAAIAAALRSGCFGSGPILTNNDVAGAYEPDFLRVAGTGGNELRTIVVGNPFGGSAEATSDATIEAMQGAVAFTPVRFAPSRAGRTRRTTVCIWSIRRLSRRPSAPCVAARRRMRVRLPRGCDC